MPPLSRVFVLSYLTTLALTAAAAGGGNLSETFDVIDSNKDGEIDLLEFNTIVGYMGQNVDITITQLKEAFQSVDTDMSGKISFSEFSVLLGISGEETIPTADDEDNITDVDDEDSINSNDQNSINSNEDVDDDNNSILTDAFDLFDIDQSKTLDGGELEVLMKFLGQNLSQLELSGMMNSMDKDENGAISLSEFYDLMASTAAVNFEKEKRSRDYFASLDKDNSGNVSLIELHYALASAGEKLTANQVVAMFKAADTNNNNAIDFEEFVNAFD